jgi:hypothetical protein
MRVMMSGVTSQNETDILILDVSDDALERVAAVASGQQRITIGICTDWHNCQWPLSPAERAAAHRN